MSIHVSSLVWDYSLASGSALIILVSLADQANDEGWCWPSVGNITKRSRLDDRTVQRQLDWLEKRGEITRTYRPGRSTMYHIETSLLRARCTPVMGDTPVNLTPPSPVTDPPVMGDTPPPSPVTPRTVIEPSLNHQKRATRVTEDWQPRAEVFEAISAECPNVDLAAQHRTFIDYWIAKPGQAGLKLDWDATWRNWMRRAHETTQPAGSSKPGSGYTWGWED